MEKSNVNVKFNGLVIAATAKKAVVATVALDRNKRSYTTDHTVKLNKNTKLAEGQYVAISGTLESDGMSNWIEPKACTLLGEAPSDQNMYAWVDGEAASSFFMPNNGDEFSDARPFGVASIKVNETRRQRGVVFNNLIGVFKKNLKAGAVVRLAGRLQYRKFQDRATGETREVAEIICNNEYSKILKLSERINPFSFGDDSAEDEALMAGFAKASE
jgi:hypothetical protein